MITDCCDKGKLMDAECIYENGKFIMGSLPGCLPGLFTVRFRAPADYAAGDVVVVKGKELPVRTPGMAAAASDIFKAGAVIHCDIDLDRELAFFWQGGGSGTAPAVVPNLSYEEQFAGFYAEDGKKVYMKSVDFGTLPNNTEKSVAHNIANFHRLISMTPRWYASNNGRMRCPNSMYTPTFYGDFYIGGVNLGCTTTGNMTQHSAIVSIYYTCTDR